MKPKKVCVVIGTRPEAIKMAPVILELLKYPHKFNVEVCSTGQHTSMLVDALSPFKIMPNINLEVMNSGQSLAELTSRLLVALDGVFEKIQPNIVLVHGDTSSAMAGALVAFYRQINVGHVEAGLRTQNLYSPFPEEYNRRSVAISASYHFAPTELARLNLEGEGVSPTKIIVTGNTVIDALQLTIRNILSRPDATDRLRAANIIRLGFDPEKQDFVLVTAHRRENLGVGLENICRSIYELAIKNPKLYFVYPIHLNPKVNGFVKNKLNKIPNVALLDPLDYFNFAWLLYNCLFVLTDSGGIQEEAPSLGKPVLVMRDTSERPEAIQAGTAKLVTTKVESIIKEAQSLIDNKNEYQRMSKAVNPYGDGNSSIRIVQYLLDKI